MSSDQTPAPDHVRVTQDIPFGDPGRNVYAAREGDTVPAELVEANGWQEYVEQPKASTKKTAAADKAAAGDKTDGR